MTARAPAQPAPRLYDRAPDHGAYVDPSEQIDPWSHDGPGHSAPPFPNALRGRLGAVQVGEWVTVTCAERDAHVTAAGGMLALEQCHRAVEPAAEEFTAWRTADAALVVADLVRWPLRSGCWHAVLLAGGEPA